MGQQGEIRDPPGVGRFDETLPDLPSMAERQIEDVLEEVERHVSKSTAGLIPYKVMIYPKTGAKPYMSTRWKHVPEGVSPIHVIPAASYMGNLFEVFQAWQNFVSRLDDRTDDLLRPIVALQEVLLQGRAGVLAVQDNRIIGIAALQQGEDLVTASPLDQLRGQEKAIIHTLNSGLKAYELVIQ